MKIEFPDWVGYMTEQGAEPTHHHYGFQKQFKKWFDEHVTPVNEMIEHARIVYGNPGNCEWQDYLPDNPSVNYSYSALLINIQPIKQDTAEDVLRDFVEASTKCHPNRLQKLTERARAILKKEKSE